MTCPPVPASFPRSSAVYPEGHASFPGLPKPRPGGRIIYPEVKMTFPSISASFPAPPEVRLEGKMLLPTGQAFGIEGKRIGKLWLRKEEDSVQTGRRCLEIRTSGPKG